MNYGYHENALYFHCATQGRKIDLIRKNSRVGFEVTEKSEIVKDDVACKWTTKFRSVIGFGEMSIICDHEEKKQGLEFIMKHHGKDGSEFDDRIVDRVLVLKLEIKGLSGKELIPFGFSGQLVKHISQTFRNNKSFQTAQAI
jgi:nitroimidazol reductase NimA-like FMN-containing flavoprotein (pyridoxamine 5'-phosphate oxidase superfamily)